MSVVHCPVCNSQAWSCQDCSIRELAALRAQLAKAEKERATCPECGHSCALFCSTCEDTWRDGDATASLAKYEKKVMAERDAAIQRAEAAERKLAGTEKDLSEAWQKWAAEERRAEAAEAKLAEAERDRDKFRTGLYAAQQQRVEAEAKLAASEAANAELRACLESYVDGGTPREGAIAALSTPAGRGWVRREELEAAILDRDALFRFSESLREDVAKLEKVREAARAASEHIGCVNPLYPMSDSCPGCFGCDLRTALAAKETT